ncbi:class III chitinase ChiA1 [Aspergillus lucknowensis]|uniref:chitinase n=1 Tax=Aspergillus lucknowensis TaxID=176173 RepID=A0ABR4LG45_9EURO
MASKLLTFVSAISALASQASAFHPEAKSNVAVYYGQGFNQPRLAEFCQETAFDIINIGFINRFPDQDLFTGLPGSDFGNQCWADTYFVDGLPSMLYSQCPNLREDIPICQAAGKKIFLSLGGGHDTYKINTIDSSTKFADFLWGAFGPKTEDWEADDKPRPFGDAVVDGFDFDIEYNGSLGYANMIKRLRRRFTEVPDRTFYISVAPQCPIPDKQLSVAIANSLVDFVWVQFYNSNPCSARDFVEGTKNGFNFDDWVEVIKEGANPNAKLYVGLPASQSAALPGYYLTPQEVEPLVKKYMNKYPETFGGIMLWEATESKNNQIDGVSYADKIRDILFDLDPNHPTPTPSPTPTPTPTLTTTASTFTSTTSTTTTPTPSETPSSSTSSTPVVSETTSTTMTSASTTSTSVTPSGSSTPTTSSAPVVPPTSAETESSTQTSTPSTIETSTTCSGTTVSSTSTYPSSSSSPSTTPTSSGSSSTTPSSTPLPSSSPTASETSTSSHTSHSDCSTTSPSSAPGPQSPSSSTSTVASTSTHTASNTPSVSETPSGTVSPTSSRTTVTLTVFPTPPSSAATPSPTVSASSSSVAPPETSTEPSTSETSQISSLSTSRPVIPTPSSSSTSAVPSTGPENPTPSGSGVPTLSPSETLPSQTVTTSSGDSDSTTSSAESTEPTARPSTTSPAAESTTKPTDTGSVTSNPITTEPATTTTIIVTSYTSICPTGFTTITTTLTSTYCPSTATATGTPDIPESWTTTITVCTVCAATPTTVTLTLPPATSTDEPTAVQPSDVPGGKNPNGDLTTITGPASTTTYVVIPVPTASASRPVIGGPYPSSSSFYLQPSPSRPVSPSGTQNGENSVFTGAASCVLGLSWGSPMLAALILSVFVMICIPLPTEAQPTAGFTFETPESTGVLDA